MEKTLGQKRVRTSFNPSEITKVDVVKNTSASMIDLMEETRTLNEINITGWTMDDTKEFNRLVSLSQTAFEEAAMWATKALTYKP